MKTKLLKFFALAGVALSIASCSQEDPAAPVQGNNDGAIRFNQYIGRSRAAALTTATLSDFGILAYNNDGAAYQTGQTPDFMYNQLVTRSGEGWEYAPIKYWPSDPTKKISFFAYAPYTNFPVNPTNGSSFVSSISSNSADTDPNLTFKVGKDITKQIDLVYAKAMDLTSAYSTVDLSFKHALSRVGFKVIGWEPNTGESFDLNTEVTINAVKLCTERQMATLNLYTGEWSDPVDDTERHAYSISTENGLIQNNVLRAGDTDVHRLNLDGDYIMMLPDLSGKDRYVLIVDYTTVTADPSLAEGKTTVRNKTYRFLEPNFEQGKAYDITIHLGMNGYNGPDDGIQDPDEPDPVDPDQNPDDPEEPTPTPPGSGDYIKFTTTVSDWVNGTEPDVSYHPTGGSLSIHQEDFHIAGYFGEASDSRATNTLQAISLIKKGGTENILKESIEIPAGNFTIPASVIDLNKIENGNTYVLSITNETNVTYSANITFSFASTEFTIDVPFSGSEFTMPLAQTPCPAATVFAWGDGQQSAELSQVTSTNNSHSYAYAGETKVRILSAESNRNNKQMPYFNFYQYGTASWLVSMDTPLMNTGQPSMAKAFYNCTALRTIVPELFANNAQITDFSQCWLGCTELQGIPATLFEYVPNAVDFSSTFYRCSNVTTNVPNLWETHSGATSYAYCFGGCTKAANWEAIPNPWK